MKREGTIGAAAALFTVLAVVGISLQPGSKPAETRSTQSTARRTKPSITKDVTHKEKPGCDSLKDQLDEFLDVEIAVLPDQCYENNDQRKENNDQPPPQADLIQKTSQLKFVIALLPDPVHTHLPVLFDQFAIAVQEGAQDEHYDFDSSWLPWDEEETSYQRYDDEKLANSEKAFKEDEPGIILFRKTPNSSGDLLNKEDCKGKQSEGKPLPGILAKSFCEGLAVFVVGEEATGGIHQEQFRNALKWIAALQAPPQTDRKPLAILGPTFSGSIPSLAKILLEPRVSGQLDVTQTQNHQQLAIYSGSVTSKSSAQDFQFAFPQVRFRSFVQNDDENLQRFQTYIEKGQGLEISKIAIVSEDETAYGGSGLGTDQLPLRLYYPRDISALRQAYQAKSLFSTGATPQPENTPQRTLPTDLADPTGKVHDSIRSYGGNQTPLVQEAILMKIVEELREHEIQYILLRSSSSLDQLFLADFLRRSYPNGRIVILGSDLMFVRERGATALNGVMTLNNYPLFPLEHEWTAQPPVPRDDRIFSSDTMEGTYIAFRMLLNDKSVARPDDAQCSVSDGDIFLPPVSCKTTPATRFILPDYALPFWMSTDRCRRAGLESKDATCYPGPATWISVIGINRFWPTAALTESPVADNPVIRSVDNAEIIPGEQPEMPLQMTICFLALAALALFHAWCCWSGSYTAKPAFLAHFASQGEKDHFVLIFSGCWCIATMAMVAALGAGVFSVGSGMPYPLLGLSCMLVIFVLMWTSILANGSRARALAKDAGAQFGKISDKAFTAWKLKSSGIFVATIMIAGLLIVLPLELALRPESRVLTYWRAMHLASAASPVVPIFSVLVGLYLAFWFTLHGLALFGPDRPMLPQINSLLLERTKDGKKEEKDVLRMFSEEDAATSIENYAAPLRGQVAPIGVALGVGFLGLVFGLAQGVPIRSLGSRSYALIFLVGLDICFTFTIITACRFYKTWTELKRLLGFLDRLPLRRTMAALRGFSWGSVWKMSDNVLEVRYKVISRQLETMNHAVSSLQEFKNQARTRAELRGVVLSLRALQSMHRAGMKFADWYSTNYRKSGSPAAGEGNLNHFQVFQKRVAAATGTLLSQLLVPAWHEEQKSLILEQDGSSDKKDTDGSAKIPLAEEEHIRNAEEFVCLTYLAFVQNILGRIRTMAFTMVALFLACSLAMSTYPFDPRQGLSTVLIILFVIAGATIVKVYADMHRDSTLSHVTNTKPGELGGEFWIKILGFGFAPLVGLLTRIFPGITDFIFSWLQPGMSSFK